MQLARDALCAETDVTNDDAVFVARTLNVARELCKATRLVVEQYPDHRHIVLFARVQHKTMWCTGACILDGVPRHLTRSAWKTEGRVNATTPCSQRRYVRLARRRISETPRIAPAAGETAGSLLARTVHSDVVGCGRHAKCISCGARHLCSTSPSSLMKSLIGCQLQFWTTAEKLFTASSCQLPLSCCRSDCRASVRSHLGVEIAFPTPSPCHASAVYRERGGRCAALVSSLLLLVDAAMLRNAAVARCITASKTPSKPLIAAIEHVRRLVSWDALLLFAAFNRGRRLLDEGTLSAHVAWESVPPCACMGCWRNAWEHSFCGLKLDAGRIGALMQAVAAAQLCTPVASRVFGDAELLALSRVLFDND